MAVKHVPTSEVHSGTKGGTTGCGFDTKVNPTLGIDHTKITCDKTRMDARTRLEVVSKIPQHDFDASESDHTQEIVDVVLVARNQAAKHLQPSEQTLDCPAPPIAA